VQRAWSRTVANTSTKMAIRIAQLRPGSLAIDFFAPLVLMSLASVTASIACSACVSPRTTSSSKNTAHPAEAIAPGRQAIETRDASLRTKNVTWRAQALLPLVAGNTPRGKRARHIIEPCILIELSASCRPLRFGWKSSFHCGLGRLDNPSFVVSFLRASRVANRDGSTALESLSN